jgi:hypothetical protein
MTNIAFQKMILAALSVDLAEDVLTRTSFTGNLPLVRSDKTTIFLKPKDNQRRYYL